MPTIYISHDGDERDGATHSRAEDAYEALRWIWEEGAPIPAVIVRIDFNDDWTVERAENVTEDTLRQIAAELSSGEHYDGIDTFPDHLVPYAPSWVQDEDRDARERAIRDEDRNLWRGYAAE